MFPVKLTTKKAVKSDRNKKDAPVELIKEERNSKVELLRIEYRVANLKKEKNRKENTTKAVITLYRIVNIYTNKLLFFKIQSLTYTIYYCI